MLNEIELFKVPCWPNKNKIGLYSVWQCWIGTEELNWESGFYREPSGELVEKGLDFHMGLEIPCLAAGNLEAAEALGVAKKVEEGELGAVATRVI